MPPSFPAHPRSRGSELPWVFAAVALFGAGLWWTRPRPVGESMAIDAQKAGCLANLGRIGLAFAQYAQDYNGKYPRGTDPEDFENKNSWSNGTYGNTYYKDVQEIPPLFTLLLPYTKTRDVWRCPADVGWSGSHMTQLHSYLIDVHPSSYTRFGSSYYYWTIFGLAGMTADDLRAPTQTAVLFDGDFWHRSNGQLALNSLFADGHTSTLTQREFQAATRFN